MKRQVSILFLFLACYIRVISADGAACRVNLTPNLIVVREAFPYIHLEEGELIDSDVNVLYSCESGTHLYYHATPHCPGLGTNCESKNNCKAGRWQYAVAQCVFKCPIAQLQRATTWPELCKFKSTLPAPCTEDMWPGSTVQIECKPGYYKDRVASPTLTCANNGTWMGDQTPTCRVVCGRDVQSIITTLSRRDKHVAHIKDVPWSVAIYQQKDRSVFAHICGGTLLTNRLVLTAAHCFWDVDKKEIAPRQQYYVVAGKLFTAWEHPEDAHAQRVRVRQIKTPTEYEDLAGNYIGDLAMLLLSERIRMPHQGPMPICLDRPVPQITREQWTSTLFAGWGDHSKKLNRIDMPFVDRMECQMHTNLRFLTEDKICAGQLQAEASPCHGDSGGGVAVYGEVNNQRIYTLLGVISARTGDKASCVSNSYTLLTSVHYYQDWIWGEIDRDEQNYQNGRCDASFLEHHSLDLSIDDEDFHPDQVETLPMGSQVHLNCKYGYRALGLEEQTLTCGADGTWSASRMRCEPECGVLDDKVRDDAGNVVPLAERERSMTRLPWHVTIYDDQDQLCGGTLVSEQLVLTAAACLTDREAAKLLVYTAKTGLTSEDERIDGYAVYNVSQIRNQINVSSSQQMGLALLFLDRPVQFTANVRTVCLPERRTTAIGRRNGYTAAWELRRREGRIDARQLRVPLRTMPHYECQDTLRSMYQKTLPDGGFCAQTPEGREDDPNLCYGESGNGLVSEAADQRWELMGVLTKRWMNRRWLQCEQVLSFFTDAKDVIDFVRQARDELNY